MANDLLITAIRQAGLDIGDIAQIAEADPRTVQRWLGGRIPHPRYRLKIAAALGVEETELWPDTRRARGKAALGEITAAVARRSDPDAPDWRALMRSSTQHVDLLGYSLADVLKARQVDKQLIAKAAAGCQVRIAIASPDSEAVLAADAQQKPAGRLLARVRDSHAQLAGLIGQSGVALRQHRTATSHTILRFDDHLLLTIHLHGTPGFQAPQLHLHRELDYGIFDQLAKHFEDVWQTSTPIGNANAVAATAAEATAGEDAERKRFLDSLDDIWRPAPG